MKATKYPFAVTPRATAAYTWLDKPDTAFGDEKFKITLVLPKGELTPGRIERGTKELTGDEWMKYLITLCKSHGVSCTPGDRGCPIKDGDKMYTKDGAPREQFSGSWVIPLKSGYKPDLVDTKGTPLPRSVQILNGDLVRALIVPTYRNVSGADYLSLYLNKVALVEKRSAVDTIDASVFGEEDGYVVPADAVDETPAVSEEEVSGSEWDF